MFLDVFLLIGLSLICNVSCVGVSNATVIMLSIRARLLLDLNTISVLVSLVSQNRTKKL